MEKYTTKLDLDTRYKSDEKDRQFPVRLRVTLDRVHHYFPTDKKATKTEWDKMNSKKPGDLKDTISDLQDTESLGRRILGTMPKWDKEEFAVRLKSKDQSMVNAKSLEFHFKKYEKDLWNREQVKTARNYGSARGSIEKFTPELLITDITADLLKNYQHWMLKKEDKSLTTVSMYMRALRTIINRAIDLGGFPDEKKYYPFGKNKYQIPAPLQKKKSLSQAEMKNLMALKPTDKEKEFARDMFLFSFYCGGPNPVDIAKLKYDWIRNNHIHFPTRSKNANNNQEPIPPAHIHADLKKIIEKWKVPGEYVFGILDDSLSALQADNRINSFIKRVNEGLAAIALDDLKFIDKPTFGIARHTQANILRTKGVSMEVIQKGMGHASLKTTKIYLKQLEAEKPNAALSKLRLPKNKTA